MGSEKFIRCCVCDAIHYVSRFDRSPAFVFLGDEVEAQAMDDWRLFMTQHAGHRLEPLEASGDKLFPGGSPLDPMSVCYIEVTNGQDRYVVRRARKSIQEPMSYELIRGRLTETDLTVEIQENEIKKEMKNHISWAPATCPDDDKINFFIGLIKDAVKILDPQRIQISETAYTDDSISYGTVDSAILDGVTERCAVYFLPDEVASLRRFVETHRSGCDVMTLVLRRRMTVERVACS
jgi:hypothetical protein